MTLCAEGTDVESTFVTGHAIDSGTSFAAPKPAAAVAQVMDRQPSLTAHQAAEILRNDTNRPLVPGAGRFVDPA